MHDFDSQQLSPRRLQRRVECDLPYGLAWEDLRPCLADLDVARAAECRAFRAFEKQGRSHYRGSADSCILTVEYPTTGVASSETTVFVKDIVDPLHMESERYDFLAKHGIPTPRLLTKVAKRAGEVIVIEFLPRISIDVSSWAEVEELLSLLARLNAVPAPPGMFDLGPGTPRERMDARRKAGLAKLALDPRAGVDVDRWFEAFEASREAVIVMPVALTHGEFHFQQCGWAHEGREAALVIFDLATMGHRPRFADLTSIFPAVATATGRSEIEVLEVYLAYLRQHGGARVEAREAMDELRLYRIEGVFSALYWLTHEVYEPLSDDLLRVAQQIHADMVEARLLAAP